MGESISFDRAAAFYDATRSLPDDLAHAITRALLAEVRAAGAERVLEVGIGTGRMARPLMREGVQIVGVDISREMMARLLAQLTTEHTSPDLLLADGTALPFRDGSFRAAMVVHVLHLVASVEGALSEISRVLAPGGILLHQTRRADDETQRAWDSHDEFWDRVCAEHGYTRRHRPTDREIESAILASGAWGEVIELTVGEDTSSVSDELSNLRERKHSWSWSIPDDIAEASTDAFEQWLRNRAGPDGRFTDRVTYVIEKWQWP